MYQDPNIYIFNFEAVLRNSGVNETDWILLIEEQLSNAVANWFTLIKSMGLTWTKFCGEFSDRRIKPWQIL